MGFEARPDAFPCTIDDRKIVAIFWAQAIVASHSQLRQPGHLRLSLDCVRATRCSYASRFV